jgi:hypothetical protein
MQKIMLWKMYFLKTANSLSDCDHIDKIQAVDIWYVYLQ